MPVMRSEHSAAASLSRLLIGTFILCGAAIAAFLPPPTTETRTSWETLAIGVAGIVATIAAIWLGMLFGVAFDRANQGSRGGASELVRQLLRPLQAGGVTIIAAILLAVASPYLDAIVLPGALGRIAYRGRVFVSLMLCAGALYSLLLSLAPVEHIRMLIRAREAEADTRPQLSNEREFASSRAGTWD
jgi:hypothetical protein